MRSASAGRGTARWLAAAVVAAALVAAGCGSDEGSGSSGGGGGGGETTGGAKVGEGKQGGAVTFLASADVDYLDPGQTYYTFGFMVHYAVNRTLYSFKPEDSSTPVPDLAEGPPDISADNKTITIKVAFRREVRPAGLPRGDVEGHQVRDRARVHVERAVGLRDVVLRRDRRRPVGARVDQQAQAVPGPADPGRPHAGHQAHQAGRAARRGRPRPADHDAGARGLRAQVRREEPDGVRPVRRVHGSVHGQERPVDRQGHGPRAGQAHRDRPQPELGQVDRLPAGVPGLDHHRGGQRRPHRRLAPDARRAAAHVLRHRAAADLDPQARADALSRTSSAACRAAARAGSR